MEVKNESLLITLVRRCTFSLKGSWQHDPKIGRFAKVVKECVHILTSRIYNPLYFVDAIFFRLDPGIMRLVPLLQVQNYRTRNKCYFILYQNFIRGQFAGWKTVQATSERGASLFNGDHRKSEGKVRFPVFRFRYISKRNINIINQ